MTTTVVGKDLLLNDKRLISLMKQLFTKTFTPTVKESLDQNNKNSRVH